MKLMRVKHADVYPSEGNPRRDFGDLDAMAAGFALNPTAPGEPLTPPLLVQDGQVYLIVDGERRWRAMAKAGTKEFSAIVCEDWADADAALAMLATDDKKGLDEVERSRGVQRCLLLGVPEEKVEKAARRKGARKIRRAMDAVGVDAESMSLDHLFAIAEFEGDPERAERIANASEQAFARVAEECRAERDRERAHTALVSKAEELGLDIREKCPDGCAYAAMARMPEGLETEAEAHPGAVWVIDDGDQWRQPSATAYVEREEQAEDSDEDEGAAAETMRAIDGLRMSVSAWLAEALMDGSYPESSMAAAVAGDLGNPEANYSAYALASRWLDGMGYDGPRPDGRVTGMAGAALLRGWIANSFPTSKEQAAQLNGDPVGQLTWAVGYFRRMVACLAAAMSDGWKPTPAEDELRRAAVLWLRDYDAANPENNNEEE